MDVLADYGSDDDSSSNGSGAPNAADATEPSVALGGLVAYSDDEDDNDEGKEQGPTQTESLRSKPPPSKRQRTENDDATAADPHHFSQQRQLLPDPPLSDTSMIHWTVDYSAPYRRTSSTTTDTLSSQQQQKLSEKLATLRQSRSSSSSWAEHLRSQHDFHNPRFFHNVVDYFGIQEPLACHSVKTDIAFQSYEYNLVQAEEQARIRQQEKQQRSVA